MTAMTYGLGYENYENKETFQWKRKAHAGEAVPVLRYALVSSRAENGGKIDFPYLSFPLLEQTGMVDNLFTTRLGGASEGIYATTNLSFSMQDNPEAVKENYRRIAQALATEVDYMVASHQTHTTNVRLVTEKDLGKGIVKERDYQDVDGLITDIPGVCLVTFCADCVPLYFVDPAHRAIGLSHSGWRGTVKRMGEKTLTAMKEAFGTRPEEVLCAIGPSICQDCYEVSEDVAEEFSTEFAGHEDAILKRGRASEEGQKWQLDLWEANRVVLTEAGVLPEHLEITDLCTCCNSTYLFSHRATQGKRGNLGAFLKLREEN